MVWYYELRGYIVYRHTGIVRTKKHRVKIENDPYDKKHLIISRDCEYLQQDLKCKGHPDKKPLVCQGLNHDNKDRKEYYLTKGCIYADDE